MKDKMKSKVFSKFFQFISTFLKRNRLIVLTYHQVGDFNAAHNKLLLDTSLFEQHLIWLKQHFRVLCLEDAMRRLLNGTLPKRAVVISIDDGYVDGYTTIFPLLIKHKLQASFFISTSGIEKGYLWDELVSMAIMKMPIEKPILTFLEKNYPIETYNEKLAAIDKVTQVIKYVPLEKRDELIGKLCIETGYPSIKHQFLSNENIQEMNQAGMCIGAHTVNHPILTLETPDNAKKEMLDSKLALEQQIGSEVKFLAYPNGKLERDFTLQHQQQARECGFEAAFSTEWGCSTLDNLFAIKRITLSEKTELKFCMRLLLNIMR